MGAPFRSPLKQRAVLSVTYVALERYTNILQSVCVSLHICITSSTAIGGPANNLAHATGKKRCFSYTCVAIHSHLTLTAVQATSLLMQKSQILFHA